MARNDQWPTTTAIEPSELLNFSSCGYTYIHIQLLYRPVASVMYNFAIFAVLLALHTSTQCSTSAVLIIRLSAALSCSSVLALNAA